MELSNVDQCAHKILRKQMSGMQVWYVCAGRIKPNGEITGCGQKFKASEWSGKVVRTK